MYPLQVSAKKTLEWAYYQEEQEEWTVVDKSILEGDGAAVVDGIEKLIGFEGRPDPASGYYCVYDGGRLQKKE